MSKERVRAEISLSAFHHNIAEIQKKCRPETKLLAVIKTNAYGHGAERLAKELEPLSFTFGYAVATAEEALALREAGLKKPILILGYTFPEDHEALIRAEVRPAVFTLAAAEELNKTAEKLARKANIHLKVDTGMGRIGLSCDEEGLSIARSIAALSHISIEGIFTHFSRADETDQAFAYLQFQRFTDFCDKLLKEGISIPIRHCANSAAIATMPDTSLSLSRAGIILYGLYPSDAVGEEKISLEPLMSLKSSIVYIKELLPGAPISYGGTFVTTKKTRVATIPVGYGDGYPRMLSGKGEVLIRGKRAPILGRVCMDQFMADVTDIPEASLYDEVVLMGRQGNERITAEELGALSGRFNYELVCDISGRVPRVYI
ncbi:MAG: alanine racemase [Lachnospiraceae bacterium]|nr:alanine racemase [Lachnospiraceae bacterium]